MSHLCLVVLTLFRCCVTALLCQFVSLTWFGSTSSSAPQGLSHPGLHVKGFSPLHLKGFFSSVHNRSSSTPQVLFFFWDLRPVVLCLMCLLLGDILKKKIEGPEPATVELSADPCVLLSFFSSSSTSFLLSLLSSDRVTGLVAASSKARPHARRFTTSAILCTKSDNKTRTRRKEKKIYASPGVQ